MRAVPVAAGLVSVTMVAFAGSLSAQTLPQPVAQRPVRSDLAEVAQTGSVGDFARALAKSEVPAGMIVRRAQAPTTGRVTRLLAQPAGKQLGLGVALGAFGRRHPGYKIAESHGALLLAPENSVCRPPLERVLTNLQIRAPLYAAGFELMKRINPKLAELPPPGIVASGQSEDRGPMFGLVGLYYQQITLREALDEAVRQVPGIVWAFVEDVDRVSGKPKCLLHWYMSSGVGFTSYDSLGGGEQDVRVQKYELFR